MTQSQNSKIHPRERTHAHAYAQDLANRRNTPTVCWWHSYKYWVEVDTGQTLEQGSDIVRFAPESWRYIVVMVYDNGTPYWSEWEELPLGDALYHAGNLQYTYPYTHFQVCQIES